MGFFNFERIQHAHRIVGQVAHAVGRVDGAAQPVFKRRPHQIWFARVVEMLAQPDVTVVMPDDAVASSHQHLYQRWWPGNELHSEAHDEQYCGTLLAAWTRTGARVFDFDVNSICYYFHIDVCLYYKG